MSAPRTSVSIRLGAAWSVILLWLASLPGCFFGPGRVDAPDIDPPKVAEAFIEQYDTDGDARLSQAELADCPPLASSLSAYDKNDDGQISADEISSRLAKIYRDKIAIFQIYATVTLDGRPLANAEVELAPEAALEGQVKAASGRTNRRGVAAISISEEDMPADLRGVVHGVQTGLYRIKVRHDKKRLSAGIPAGDVLGQEITPADGDRGLRLNLKS